MGTPGPREGAPLGDRRAVYSGQGADLPVLERPFHSVPRPLLMPAPSVPLQLAPAGTWLLLSVSGRWSPLAALPPARVLQGRPRGRREWAAPRARADLTLLPTRPLAFAAKAQKIEMDKLEKAKKERTKVRGPGRRPERALGVSSPLKALPTPCLDSGGCSHRPSAPHSTFLRGAA